MAPEGGGPAVRTAERSDLDELVRLDGLARAHLSPLRGGDVLLAREIRPTPVAASFERELSDAQHCVLIGDIGGAAVGYAAAHVEELHDGSRHAEVTELYVEPEARAVGVGQMLMRSLVDWSTRQGCSGIGSTVLPGDRASKNFFESFGLVARAILVHRELDPE